MTDRGGTPGVLMVNEELARRMCPGEGPVGKILRLFGYDFLVAGMVGDVRAGGGRAAHGGAAGELAPRTAGAGD